ncbi:hypothetical protein [Thermus altitudinis]|uniref:hypothetical protein n=1 Tax=Thermus altitudinis TaxID=2908145 RepID=UPI001FAA6E44|nr:hypothetical protein [Thermus altitudinis]
MARTLALLLLVTWALAQVDCDATGVVFDLSEPGPLTVQNGYTVANLSGYLHLLDVGSSLLLLPTRVVGATVPYRVTCTVRTGGGGGGGVLCGAGTTLCFRLTGITGTLPAPLDPLSRLYLMVQPVSGSGVVSHAPSPTPLGNLPDNRGLASIPRNTTAVLALHFFLLLSPEDAFPSLPASGTLTLTYGLRRN